MKHVWSGIVLVALLSLVSCRGCKDRDDILQPFPVDITININEPAYFSLTAVGGWIYYNTGTAKVILHRRTLDDIMCYDNRSPYNVSAGCTMSVQDDNVSIKDNCSDSKWLLTDGTLLNGPASRPLLQYQTTFNTSLGTLRMFN